MRRTQPQETDPEVQADRSELEVIKGEKARIESEISSTILNHQKIKEKKEADEKAFDQNFDLKKKEKEAVLVKIDTEIANKKAVNESLNKENITLSSENLKYAETHKDLMKNNLKAQEEKDRLDNYINDAKKSLVGIEKQADLSKVEKEKITGEVQEMERICSDLKKTEVALKKEIEDIQKALENKNKDSRNIDLQISISNNKLNSVNNLLSEKEKELTQLTRYITESEKNLSTLKMSYVKENEDMDARRKGLSLLEQRVDEKILLAERYLEKFSVDELAKTKTNLSLTK